jgi:Ser/Thr protein kinase RdoA (MazF antagonist)
LRITHTSHRSLADIDSELEFLNYLKAQAAPVCGPVPIMDSALAVQYQDFVCCRFELAGGGQVQAADWPPGLFRRWGEAIGCFHRLAQDYVPKGEPRFGWQADANLDFDSYLPAAETQIRLLARGYRSELDTLPTTPDVFGLIHSDAHAGNFFFEANFLKQNAITFFDFDDSCYQWYAFDVATILFSAVLQPWMENSNEARVKEAKAFFPAFLEGYSRQAPIEGLMLDRLPLFLKLRELSLYAVINTHMDVDNLDGWYAIKFMAGRKARLEADQAYFPIDFSEYS